VRSPLKKNFPPGEIPAGEEGDAKKDLKSPEKAPYSRSPENKI